MILSGRANHDIFLWFVKKQQANLEKKWLNFFKFQFNPFPSLPSAASDDRNQFQYRNIVFNNKTRPLFLGFNWREDTF